jgi:hypothetical protein
MWKGICRSSCKIPIRNHRRSFVSWGGWVIFRFPLQGIHIENINAVWPGIGLVRELEDYGWVDPPTTAIWLFPMRLQVC